MTGAGDVEGRDWKFAILLTGAFAVVVTIGLSHHEMWRDELQAWMVALESRTLPDLFQTLRYEGHPALWHLLLWPLSRFTANPVGMQVLHGVLASCAVFLLALYSPFPRFQRVFLAFGYFLAFEYAVVSRGYVLGVIFTFAYCAALQRGRVSPILLGALLGLLANTSVYGAIIALALGASTLVDLGLGDRGRFRPRIHWVLGSALFVVGMSVAFATMLPPSDALFVGRPVLEGGVSAQWASAETLSHIWRAYLPISWASAGAAIWRSHFLILSTRESLALAAGLAVLTVACFAFGSARRPAALTAYVLGTTGLLTFSAFWFEGSMRHDGHLFIVLVAGMWMARTEPSRDWLPAGVSHLAGLTEKWVPRLFTVILLAQVVGAATLHAADLKYPFSGSLSVVRHIETYQLDQMPVVVTDRAQGAAIAGYLGRPVFRLDTGRWGGRADWGLEQERFETDADLLSGLKSVIGSGETAFLVSERILDPAGSEFDLTPLLRVESALVSSERFVLYSARLR